MTSAFLYRTIEYTVFGGIRINKYKAIALLGLRTMLFIMIGLPFISRSGTLSSLGRWWSVTVTICNVVTLLLLLTVCRSKSVRYGEFINYQKGVTGVWPVVVSVLVILGVGMGGMQLAGLICYNEIPHLPIMMIQPIPLWIAVCNIFLLPVTTTLAEDGIYLGVINQNSSNLVLAISAFFYAFQHSFIPFQADVRFILYRFLSFLPLTVIMCVWYRKSRNPLPLMVGHFVINLATVAQILMTSASPEIFEQMQSM